MNKKIVCLIFILIFSTIFCACDGTNNTAGEYTSEESNVAATEEGINKETDKGTDATDSYLTDGPSTDNTEQTDKAESTDTETKNETDTQTDTNIETESETKSETQTETDTETETETVDALGLVDFVVSVPADREPVILQLTDLQIIDASQQRTPDRLDGYAGFWGPERRGEHCFDYVTEIIENVNPDLILVTGDLIYGEFDDNGSNWLYLVGIMDTYGIPWAPVFGNHEVESAMGIDWQCAQLEAAEHCLFLQRSLTGNGNYTVGIEQGGKLTRVFFMLDSNGSSTACEKSLENGHTQKEPGFAYDQRRWYMKLTADIRELSPQTKFSFACHIPPAIFRDAAAKYGTDGSEPLFIDRYENGEEGDFGYFGTNIGFYWDKNRSTWRGIKELGVDSIFVGHLHLNSASVVYDGVRFQFGMKSSRYDQINYVDANGNIKGSYLSTDTPWIGGSYFKLAADGSITDADIYYCENAGGNIDWDAFK